MNTILTISEKLQLAQNNKISSVKVSRELAMCMAHDLSLKRYSIDELSDMVRKIQYELDGTVSHDQRTVVELSKLMGVSPTRVSESMTAQLRSTKVFESMIRVKRKHTDDHPEVMVSDSAVMRNKIIKFIGGHSGHKTSKEELDQFFSSLNEDEEVGKSPSMSWIYKNKHLIRKVSNKRGVYYKLTRAGVNTYKHLMEDE